MSWKDISNTTGLITIPDYIFGDSTWDNAPSTEITSYPSIDSNRVSNSSSASFSFTGSSSVNIAYFEYRLDFGKWIKLPNGVTSISFPNSEFPDSLVDGKHIFSVRSVDSEGRKDPRGAFFEWIVREDPSTTITSNLPGSNITQNTVFSISFDYSGSQNDLDHFEFRINNADKWSVLPKGVSSILYKNDAPVGTTTFEVRSVDKQGNKDSSPASISWNTIPELNTIINDSPPNNITSSSTDYTAYKFNVSGITDNASHPVLSIDWVVKDSNSNVIQSGTATSLTVVSSVESSADIVIGPLLNGSYRVEFYAKHLDAFDSTPAVFDWNIDSPAGYDDAGLWLDFSDNNSVLMSLSGSEIVSIEDKTFQYLGGFQPTSSGPTYVVDGGDGNPSARFSGFSDEDLISSNQVNSLDTSSGTTIFIVAGNSNAISGITNLVYSASQNLGGGLYTYTVKYLPPDSSIYYEAAGSDVSNNSIVSSAKMGGLLKDSSYAIFVLRLSRDDVASFSIDGAEIYDNGIELSDFGHVNSFVQLGSTSSLNSNEHFHLRDILIYRRPLTDQEISEITNKLSLRSNISLFEEIFYDDFSLGSDPDQTPIQTHSPNIDLTGSGWALATNYFPSSDIRIRSGDFAENFSGSNIGSAYIDIGDFSDLLITSEFSSIEEASLDKKAGIIFDLKDSLNFNAAYLFDPQAPFDEDSIRVESLSSNPSDTTGIIASSGNLSSTGGGTPSVKFSLRRRTADNLIGVGWIHNQDLISRSLISINSNNIGETKVGLFYEENQTFHQFFRVFKKV